MPHCKKYNSDLLFSYANISEIENLKAYNEKAYSDKTEEEEEEQPIFSLVVDLVEQTNDGEVSKIVTIDRNSQSEFKNLNSIVQILKEDNHLPNFSLIFLYDENIRGFQLIGLDPLPKEIPIFLHFDEKNQSNCLKIKFKRAPAIVPKAKNSSLAKTGGAHEIFTKTKERSLDEVIKLVLEWRRLSHGFWEGSVFKKLSLEQTALAIGVPKKTLDDYLFQLKIGRIYKFDYERHFFEKVGVLRNFVKKFKNSEKNQKYQRLDLDFFEYFASLSNKMNSQIQPFVEDYSGELLEKESVFLNDKQDKIDVEPEKNYNPSAELFSSNNLQNFLDYQENPKDYFDENSCYFDFPYPEINQNFDSFDIEFPKIIKGNLQ